MYLGDYTGIIIKDTFASTIAAMELHFWLKIGVC